MGLTVVCKSFLQFFAGEEYAAFNCTDRQPHVVGDFVVFVAGNVHREWDSVSFCKFVDSSSDFGSPIRSFRRFDTGVLAQVEMIEIVGGVYHCSRANASSVIVDEDVSHNCEHPSFEISVFGVFVFVVKRLEGGVLKEVVCVISVAGEHVCEI